MENTELSYLEKTEREFGKGVTPRGLRSVKKDITEKEMKRDTLRKAYKDAQSNWKNNPGSAVALEKANKAQDAYDKAVVDYENAEKGLFTGDVFGSDSPDETVGLIPSEGEIDLADLYGVKFETNNKTARIVIENGDDTTKADIVNEGEDIPAKNLLDYVSVIKTTRENIQQIANILKVSETMLNDDTELFYGAIDSVQKKHIGNKSTYLLCKAIQTKESIPVTSDSLTNVINTTLSAKHRLNSEIIVGESGFALLDVNDANGNPLVKRNFEINEFIFADKYIIRILSDDTLPKNEDGSCPIFVGDWKNVLRLAVVKEYPPLEKLDLYHCVVENRNIKNIIPLIINSSDKAYFVGAIS